MESHFIMGLVGGAMIGLAAGSLLVFNGRIAGISGIYGGVLRPARGDALWRALFVLGLVAGGLLLRVLRPEALPMGSGDVPATALVLVAAGLLVGVGTQMGSGCTSGHGVCGMSRLSPRSLVATVTFMFTGMLTVLLAGHVLGG